MDLISETMYYMEENIGVKFMDLSNRENFMILNSRAREEIAKIH